jgi:hypothetical protein
VTTPARPKALAYAEDALGVHQIYQQAIEFRNFLDKTLTELATARDNRRDIEARLSDAEMEVVIEERGKHPDMAVTRWEKHIKEAFQQNEAVRDLREQLTKIVGDIEGLDYDRSMAETDIKIAVSRMTELGGYLQYLAAVKTAETMRAAPTPTQPGETE